MQRRAFTLVELLVVVTIIGILAGIGSGALFLARESAKKQKTRSTIEKLDTLIQQQYDEYASRRLPLNTSIRGKVNGLRMPPAVVAVVRLRIIRHLMKWEMPDHLSDVLNPAQMDDPHTMTVSGNVRLPDGSMRSDTWEVSISRSAIARAIFRRCQGMANPDEDNSELLYIWLTAANREARDLIRSNEIGDRDQDGFPEFIDGWGRPIKFLRWPTGFVSESDIMSGDPDKDHDPFDLRKVDPAAFRTVPLVWSSGPDGISGLDLADIPYAWDTIYSAEYGKPVDASHEEYQAHLDNVNNHVSSLD